MHSNSLEMLQLLKDHLEHSRFSHQVQRLNFSFVGATSLQRMLFRNDIMAGRIILMEYNSVLSPGGLQLLDDLGYLTEQWMEKNRKSRQMGIECQIFLDLLHQKNVSREALNHKLQLQGWRQEHKKILFLLEIPTVYQDIIYPLFSRLEHVFPGSYVFLNEKRIFLLSNSFYTPEEDVCRTIYALQRESRFFCGVSYPFCDVMTLAAAQDQCAVALSAASEGNYDIYFCRDCAFDYMKKSFQNSKAACACHPAPDILYKNDQKTGNNLYGTLFAYLTNNCNIAQTARLLNLHRNSLLYRLNRIRELTFVDLDDAECRQHLYLTYIQEGRIGDI